MGNSDIFKFTNDMRLDTDGYIYIGNISTNETYNLTAHCKYHIKSSQTMTLHCHMLCSIRLYGVLRGSFLTRFYINRGFAMKYLEHVELE